MVWNDRLYLYTTHDADGSTWFTMDDWRLYSTNDMVNWTDPGWCSHTAISRPRAMHGQPNVSREMQILSLCSGDFKRKQPGAIGVAVADTRGRSMIR